MDPGRTSSGACREIVSRRSRDTARRSRVLSVAYRVAWGFSLLLFLFPPACGYRLQGKAGSRFSDPGGTGPFAAKFQARGVEELAHAIDLRFRHAHVQAEDLIVFQWEFDAFPSHSGSLRFSPAYRQQICGAQARKEGFG